MKSSHPSLNRISLGSLIVSGVLLLLLWQLTTPSGTGPLGILVVFVLLYVIFTSLILVLTGIVSKIREQFLQRPPYSERKRYYVSSVLGFFPVLYLTLLSMGGASVWGIGLVGLFIGLTLFYVLRRSV